MIKYYFLPRDDTIYEFVSWGFGPVINMEIFHLQDGKNTTGNVFAV